MQQVQQVYKESHIWLFVHYFVYCTVGDNVLKQLDAENNQQQNSKPTTNKTKQNKTKISG